MAKRTVRRTTPVRTARATEAAPAPLGNFRPPAPRGPRLDFDAIPRSTQYVPPADPAEEAAFTQPEGPPRRRRAAVEEEPDADDEPQEAIDTDVEETEPETIEELGAALDRIATRTVRRRPAPPVAPAASAAPLPLSPFASTTNGGTASAGTASRSVPALVAQVVTVTDVDHLWDWLRADRANGASDSFLGQSHATSMDLHAAVRFLVVDAEQARVGMIRSIYHGPHHLGFAMLAPILADEASALLHVYLRAEVRGQLAQFLQPLIEIAEQVVPGYHLVAYTLDPVMRRLQRQILTPLGFIEHVLFVR